jgi:hypothetical protein
MDYSKELKRPLPKEALKQHPTKRFLTVINPMFVVDRLNTVFGLFGWAFKTEVISFSEEPKCSATVKGFLRIENDGKVHTIEQYGGSDNTDLGDALKGAATDALTKCASILGIGFEVYSGQLDRQSSAPAKAEMATKAMIKKIGVLLDERLVLMPVAARINAMIAEGHVSVEDAKKTIAYLENLEKKVSDG